MGDVEQRLSAVSDGDGLDLGGGGFDYTKKHSQVTLHYELFIF